MGGGSVLAHLDDFNDRFAVFNGFVVTVIVADVITGAAVQYFVRLVGRPSGRLRLHRGASLVTNVLGKAVP